MHKQVWFQCKQKARKSLVKSSPNAELPWFHLLSELRHQGRTQQPLSLPSHQPFNSWHQPCQQCCAQNSEGKRLIFCQHLNDCAVNENRSEGFTYFVENISFALFPDDLFRWQKKKTAPVLVSRLLFHGTATMRGAPSASRFSLRTPGLLLKLSEVKAFHRLCNLFTEDLYLVTHG